MQEWRIDPSGNGFEPKKCAKSVPRYIESVPMVFLKDRFRTFRTLLEQFETLSTTIGHT